MARPSSGERKQVRYEVPADAKASKCRGCNATIYWVQTPAGKNMPCDGDGTPHWATCGKADLFRQAAER